MPPDQGVKSACPSRGSAARELATKPQGFARNAAMERRVANALPLKRVHAQRGERKERRSALHPLAILAREPDDASGAHAPRERGRLLEIVIPGEREARDPS